MSIPQCGRSIETGMPAMTTKTLIIECFREKRCRM